MFGCDIPWVIMSNNNTERKERARKLSAVFILAWLSPFLTLPLSNRFASKYIGKLTNNFWSNNHKVIHISNEFLTDTAKMMPELENLSKKTSQGPLELLYNKINKKSKYKQELNLYELLKNCNGDKELLRQRIIKAKNAVFFSDCIFSFSSIGLFPFINNEITKKKTGQQGFSAEMKMADKSVVEKRAANYEKSKKNKILAYMGIMTAATLGMSLTGFATLNSKSSNKFIETLKRNANKFDYGKGIYMSRLPLLIGSIMSQIGNVLAARNNTERKDCFIRYSFGDAVFFGGDLLLASLLYNLSDKVLKTKLTNNKPKDKSLLRKIFPKVKSIKKVLEEVESGKIKHKNKVIASSIFWGNLSIIAVSLGFIIPALVNRMIRKDVQKDVKKGADINTATPSKRLTIDEFLVSAIKLSKQS